MLNAVLNWWRGIVEWGNSATPHNPVYQDSVANVGEWADSCPVSDWDIH
jgi:hypothetical protein